jgi:hypothetical protein
LNHDGGRPGARAGSFGHAGRLEDVYAHEFGHDIDGPQYELSSDPAWIAAFESEIKGGGLTEYASQDPHEAFAEFARLMLSGEYEPGAVKAAFPAAYGFWVQNGLADDVASQSHGAGVEMAEVFGQKHALDEVSHIDEALPEGQGTAPDAPGAPTPPDVGAPATGEPQPLADEDPRDGPAADEYAVAHADRWGRARGIKDLPARALAAVRAGQSPEDFLRGFNVRMTPVDMAVLKNLHATLKKYHEAPPDAAAAAQADAPAAGAPAGESTDDSLRRAASQTDAESAKIIAHRLPIVPRLMREMHGRGMTAEQMKKALEAKGHHFSDGVIQSLRGQLGLEDASQEPAPAAAPPPAAPPAKPRRGRTDRLPGEGGAPAPKATPQPGETFRLPAHGTRRELEFTVRSDDGQTAEIAWPGADYAAATMPSASLKHFVNDLSGRVDVPPGSGDPAIDAVSSGKAEFLGKGDDGLAFRAGDKAVKVSTTVPFVPTNPGHRSPQEAADMLAAQGELNNDLARRGVPGLLPVEVKRHGDKAFLVRPYLEVPEKLTAEQAGKVRKTIDALHDLGYVVGDEIQVGLLGGEPYLFDLGKARKAGPAGKQATAYALQDDSDAYERLLKKSGLPAAPLRVEARRRFESMEQTAGFSHWEEYQQELQAAADGLIASGADEAEVRGRQRAALAEARAQLTKMGLFPGTPPEPPAPPTPPEPPPPPKQGPPFKVGQELTYTGKAGAMPAEFRGFHAGPGGERLARVIVRPESGPPFEESVRPEALSAAAPPAGQQNLFAPPAAPTPAAPGPKQQAPAGATTEADERALQRGREWGQKNAVPTLEALALESIQKGKGVSRFLSRFSNLTPEDAAAIRGLYSALASRQQPAAPGPEPGPEPAGLFATPAPTPQAPAPKPARPRKEKAEPPAPAAKATPPSAAEILRDRGYAPPPEDASPGEIAAARRQLDDLLSRKGYTPQETAAFQGEAARLGTLKGVPPAPAPGGAAPLPKAMQKRAQKVAEAVAEMMKMPRGESRTSYVTHSGLSGLNEGQLRLVGQAIGVPQGELDKARGKVDVYALVHDYATGRVSEIALPDDGDDGPDDDAPPSTTPPLVPGEVPPEQRPGAGAPAAKEPWEMTHEEVLARLGSDPEFERKYSKKYGADILGYQMFLKDAVRAGKRVPEEVLRAAEYTGVDADGYRWNGGKKGGEAYPQPKQPPPESATPAQTPQEPAPGAGAPKLEAPAHDDQKLLAALPDAGKRWSNVYALAEALGLETHGMRPGTPQYDALRDRLESLAAAGRLEKGVAGIQGESYRVPAGPKAPEPPEDVVRAVAYGNGFPKEEHVNEAAAFAEAYREAQSQLTGRLEEMNKALVSERVFHMFTPQGERAPFPQQETGRRLSQYDKDWWQWQVRAAKVGPSNAGPPPDLPEPFSGDQRNEPFPAARGGKVPAAAKREANRLARERGQTYFIVPVKDGAAFVLMRVPVDFDPERGASFTDAKYHAVFGDGPGSIPTLLPPAAGETYFPPPADNNRNVIRHQPEDFLGSTDRALKLYPEALDRIRGRAQGHGAPAPAPTPKPGAPAPPKAPPAAKAATQPAPAPEPALERLREGLRKVADQHPGVLKSLQGIAKSLRENPGAYGLSPENAGRIAAAATALLHDGMAGSLSDAARSHLAGLSQDPLLDFLAAAAAQDTHDGTTRRSNRDILARMDARLRAGAAEAKAGPKPKAPPKAPPVVLEDEDEPAPQEAPLDVAAPDFAGGVSLPDIPDEPGGTPPAPPKKSPKKSKKPEGPAKHSLGDRLAACARAALQRGDRASAVIYSRQAAEEYRRGR